MADINDTIAANTGLVYQQLHRFHRVDDPDAESFAYEALYRAVTTFDAAAGNTFATYAVCVIANALRKYLRDSNKKRQLEVISYHVPVGPEELGMCMLDTLAGPDSTLERIFASELSDASKRALAKVRSGLSVESHVKIFDAWCAADFAVRQQDVADQLSLSQAYVSRILSMIKARMKKELEDYL